MRSQIFPAAGNTFLQTQILIFCLILISMSVTVSRMMGTMIKCWMHLAEIYGKFTENS
jgi:hypothetical protein